MGTVLSPPIPAYSNLPIESQNYNPSQYFISNISLGQKTTVTTTKNVNYVIGQQVRLLIPPYSGCVQLNQATGYVLSIPMANQVTLSIDSSLNINPFVSSSQNTQPQIVAIGGINQGFSSTTGNTNLPTNIPGSFINVSY